LIQVGHPAAYGAPGMGKRADLSTYLYPSLLVEAKEANQGGAYGTFAQ